MSRGWLGSRLRRMLELPDQRKEVVLLIHMLVGTLEVRGR